MKKICEMCGVEKEIVAKAFYLKYTQEICMECLLYSIPTHTVVYQREEVKKFLGQE